MKGSTVANDKTSWPTQRRACTLEDGCETQDNRCYVSQSNECKDDGDHFILPPSSIMQPSISDPLCGRFPDTTLGLCNEKLLLSPFNYPLLMCPWWVETWWSLWFWRVLGINKRPVPPLRSCSPRLIGFPYSQCSTPNICFTLSWPRARQLFMKSWKTSVMASSLLWPG